MSRLKNLRSRTTQHHTFYLLGTACGFYFILMASSSGSEDFGARNLLFLVNFVSELSPERHKEIQFFQRDRDRLVKRSQFRIFLIFLLIV